FHLETAIHVQDLPRDVVRVTRTQKPYRVRHFFRPAITAQQDAGFDLIARKVPHRAGHFSLDDTWRHGVDVDAARRDLDRKGARKGVDSAFARGIVRLPASAFLARHRADIDNLAATLGNHERNHSP